MRRVALIVAAARIDRCLTKKSFAFRDLCLPNITSLWPQLAAALISYVQHAFCVHTAPDIVVYQVLHKPGRYMVFYQFVRKYKDRFGINMNNKTLLTFSDKKLYRLPGFYVVACRSHSFSVSRCISHFFSLFWAVKSPELSFIRIMHECIGKLIIVVVGGEIGENYGPGQYGGGGGEGGEARLPDALPRRSGFSELFMTQLPPEPAAIDTGRCGCPDGCIFFHRTVKAYRIISYTRITGDHSK